VGAALLVLGGGWAGVRHFQAKPAPRFETASVDRGPIVARVTATGVLSALVTVQVGSQVSGRLKAIAVDFNSAVKKDEVIAQIDPALFIAAMEQARANYTAAQAQVQQAKVKAVDANRLRVRDRALRDKNLIAQADFDTAETNADAADAAVTAAVANLEQAKASMHQADVNLEYCTIRSPINGVVISRNVDPGQTVAASLQAPTLFTIAEDLRRMQVDTNIAEADVGRLTAGMEATFIVDAYPSDRFKGRIRQIRNAPQTVQNVVTYDAVIDVENPDLKLKPGMTANVTIVYAQEQNALRVTNAALRYRPPPELLGKGERRSKGAFLGAAPPKGERPVWVLKDGKPTPLRVQVGITDGTLTQVLGDGLSEGDVVVTGTLESGAPAPGGPGGGQPYRRMF
jgi:HlyD family secretion protein